MIILRSQKYLSRCGLVKHFRLIEQNEPISWFYGQDLKELYTLEEFKRPVQLYAPNAEALLIQLQCKLYLACVHCEKLCQFCLNFNKTKSFCNFRKLVDEIFIREPPF